MTPTEVVEMVLSHEWESWVAIGVYGALIIGCIVMWLRTRPRKGRTFRERF